mgnify:CR=1 FL=1
MISAYSVVPAPLCFGVFRPFRRFSARRLARLLHIGEVCGIRVPTIAEEDARDLVRAREAVRADLMRARHPAWFLEDQHYSAQGNARVGAWLASQGRAWSDFDDVLFYSDSTNDLPLLERVATPIATNPTPALEAIARERGWRILKLFETP